MMNEKCAACIHCEVCGFIESEVARDGSCAFYDDGERWILIKTEHWIPVKWHNITDEERQREDYPKEWLTMLDCPMPNDEEEILVTVKSSKGGLYVEKDVCYVDDGFSLDSGYDWIDDVVAWMPLPEPYKSESEG